MARWIMPIFLQFEVEESRPNDDAGNGTGWDLSRLACSPEILEALSTVIAEQQGIRLIGIHSDGPAEPLPPLPARFELARWAFGNGASDTDAAAPIAALESASAGVAGQDRWQAEGLLRGGSPVSIGF